MSVLVSSARGGESRGSYATLIFRFACQNLDRANGKQSSHVKITWKDFCKVAYGLTCRHAMKSPPVAGLIQLQVNDTGSC